MRFKNPQTPRGVLGARHRSSPTCYLQIRVSGDLALFQALNRRCSSRTRDAARPRRSSTRTRDGFDALRGARSRALDWDDGRRARPACRASEIDERRRRSPRARERIDRLLGDGPHPAQATRSRRSARSSTSCCCAATSAAGRRASARCAATRNVQGDRTMGIWEKPAPRVPRRARRASSASRRRASTASTPSTRSARCATAGSRCSSRMGGNFVAATPDTARDRGGAARAAADRAGLDQAQPLAPRHRRRRR